MGIFLFEVLMDLNFFLNILYFLPSNFFFNIKLFLSYSNKKYSNKMFNIEIEIIKGRDEKN